MRVLFLSNNSVAGPLADWLQAQGEEVIRWSEKLTPEFVNEVQPAWVISYNYRFLIRNWLLEQLPHRVLNLHISLLPWNRGSDPNLWSFIDNTPKGVTIHEVDEGLDTGPILLQQELQFDEAAVTLQESYGMLQSAIQALFRTNWNRIKHGQIPARPQVGNPTLHKRVDLSSYLWILEQHGYGITAARFQQLVAQTQSATSEGA